MDNKELVELLRAVANGIGTLKNELGDYGLADTAADTIEALTARIEALEGERIAAAKEAEQAVLDRLRDPSVVHMAMLRGGIARPTPSQIWHIYGMELLADIPAEIADALAQEKTDA